MYSQSPGRIVFLDDPRAALSLLGKNAKLYVPCEVNSTHEFSSTLPELDEYEQVLLGRSNKFPLRSAAARIVRGDNALTLLRQAPRLLRSPQAETRRVIARNLGLFAAKDWHVKRLGALQQPLLDLLDDSDPTVRAEAAVACAAPGWKKPARGSCGCSSGVCSRNQAAPPSAGRSSTLAGSTRSPWDSSAGK